MCVCVCARVCVFSLRLFSMVGYYKILSRFPCAIQWVLVVYYFMYKSVYVNPKLLIYLPLHVTI